MITVLGASGFVGSNLVNILRKQGLDFYAPKRDEDISKKKIWAMLFTLLD